MNTQLKANPGTHITYFVNIEQKQLVIQFINQIMVDGKKAKAYSILEKAFFILSRYSGTGGPNKSREALQGEASQTLPSGFTGETGLTRFRLNGSSNCLVLFIHAIENIQPLLEVRKIRKSGRTLYIPKIVPSKRGKKIAMKWLLEEAKKNNTNKMRDKTLAECLAIEILNAFKKTGSIIKKKDDLHKLAEANRSFSHFRWW